MGRKSPNGPLQGISSNRQRCDVRGRDWATACCPHTERHATIGRSLPRGDPGAGVCHFVERHLAKHLSRDRRVGHWTGAHRAGSVVRTIQGSHARIVFAVSKRRFRSCLVDVSRLEVDRRHDGSSELFSGIIASALRSLPYLMRQPSRQVRTRPPSSAMGYFAHIRQGLNDRRGDRAFANGCWATSAVA